MLRGLAGYRILRCLASGAQGRTYLALDSRLQRRVCIKVYHLYGNLAARRLAVKEAWQLARIESPLVLQVYDVVAHGGQLALVMRYESGCDLESLLQAEPALPVANALAVVADVAAGLAALRRARVVHGDLKPANVLINTEGRAVLADFGTAICAGERPPGYSREALSPEQARGEPIDLRSDFFALGLLLYRMLHGRHPFYRDAALDIASLHRGLIALPDLEARVGSPAAVALNTLMRQLLAVRPEDRPAGTFELREVLRDIRSVLPPPDPVSATVLRIARSLPPPDAPLRLPSRLVRLPLSRYLEAWVGRYWSTGSYGAKALLFAGLLLPFGLAGLVIASPGPCIAVQTPFIRGALFTGATLPGDLELRETLTGLLKQYAPRAMVLGAGPSSDSLQTLSVRGLRDACVAERSLDLQLECQRDNCTLRLNARSPEGLRRRELLIPRSAGARYFEQGLAQLLEPQAEYLLR